MMTRFSSESPLDPDEDAEFKSAVFYENVGIGGLSNGVNQTDSALPRRRVRAI